MDQNFRFIYSLVLKLLLRPPHLSLPPTLPLRMVKEPLIDLVKIEVVHTSKGKGSKGKGKHKSKSPSVSMPLPLRGLSPKTRDGKSKCFDFNLAHGCPNKDTDCPKGHHSCMNWSCHDAKHSYQYCQAKNKKPSGGGGGQS